MWQPVDRRKAPVEGPVGMVGLSVLDGVRVGTLPTEWMWLTEVSLRSPCLVWGLEKKRPSPVFSPWFMLPKWSSCGLILVSWGNQPGL